MAYLELLGLDPGLYMEATQACSRFLKAEVAQGKPHAAEEAAQCNPGLFLLWWRLREALESGYLQQFYSSTWVAPTPGVLQSLAVETEQQTPQPQVGQTLPGPGSITEGPPRSVACVKVRDRWADATSELPDRP